MFGKPFISSRSRLSIWVLGAVVGAAALLSSRASADPTEASPAPPRPLAITDAPPVDKPHAETPPTDAPHTDPNVVPAGCSSCSSGLLGAAMGTDGGCGAGGCGGGCIPGRNNCFCGGCNCDSCVGRAFCALYDCICCPDPCYEPRWLPIADSAFFVDAARPVTQMRFRVDADFNIQHPDRAEYIWAREHTNSSSPGKELRFPIAPRDLESQSLSLYSETAAGAFSFFIETPYEHLDAEPFGSVSGFGDLNLGTKAMLLDCELLQLTFQFKTFVPTGNFTTGLGTGHVSLEPSFLFNVRLTPDAYLQGQLAYWIPLGGDSQFEGNIFHCHFSCNHKLCEPFPGLLFVGTLELNEWTFINGYYTALAAFRTPAQGSIVSAGPGVRMFVCNKLDFGVGTAFSCTGSRWAEEMIRVDFRLRF